MPAVHLTLKLLLVFYEDLRGKKVIPSSAMYRRRKLYRTLLKDKMMKKNIKTSVVILSIYILTSVFVGCGSEAVKGYRYQTTKNNLEKAMMNVIKSNPNIVLDTTQKTVIVRRYPDHVNDTTTHTINLSEFHNKDSASVAAHYDGLLKIKIKIGQIENDYVCRYLGDEHYWESSTSSEIFIIEVHDKYGKGLSQRYNENGRFKNKMSKMAKDFTYLFETEVVSKIDKELNLKHTDD